MHVLTSLSCSASLECAATICSTCGVGISISTCALCTVHEAAQHHCWCCRPRQHLKRQLVLPPPAPAPEPAPMLAPGLSLLPPSAPPQGACAVALLLSVTSPSYSCTDLGMSSLRTPFTLPASTSLILRDGERRTPY